MPIIVISATDYDGLIGSGMGSRFQTELLAEFVYDMKFRKKNINENSFVGQIHRESSNG